MESTLHLESVSESTPTESRNESNESRSELSERTVKSRDSHVSKLKMAPLAEEHFSSLQLLLKVIHTQ